MVPSWSNRAKKAVSVFFRQWNDIDVYIEDTSSVTIKVYVEILNRLVGDKFRVTRVFPLGNIEKVIEACQKDKSGRPSLYIIDGDLALLLGIKPHDLKKLYCHDRYCIENFLVDEQGAIEILYEEDAEKSKEDIRIALNFYGSFQAEADLFIELFVIYAVMRKFLPALKSVNKPISDFTSGGIHPYTDEKKISDYVGQMHKWQCDIYGRERIVKEEIEIYERTLVENSAQVFVSGKDYLFPLLNRMMRRTVKFSATKSALQIRLARHSDISKLEGLRQRLYDASLKI